MKLAFRYGFLVVVMAFAVWRCWRTKEAPVVRDQPATPPPASAFGVVAVQGNTRTAWIDKKYLNDVEALKAAAMAIDDHDGQPCSVLFFTDRTQAPTAWSETEGPPVGEALRYWHNPVNGKSQLSWPDGRHVDWRQDK